MATILFGIIVAMLLYWRLRNLFYSRLSLKYRFKFFAHRDLLRRAAIDKHINPNSRSFKYLDETFSNAACHVDRLNIFTISLWMAISNNKKNIELRGRILYSEISKEPEGKELFDAFLKDLTNYFVSKHYFLRAAAELGWSVSKMKKRMVERYDRISRNLMVSPGNQVFERHFQLR